MRVIPVRGGRLLPPGPVASRQFHRLGFAAIGYRFVGRFGCWSGGHHCHGRYRCRARCVPHFSHCFHRRPKCRMPKANANEVQTLEIDGRGDGCTQQSWPEGRVLWVSERLVRRPQRPQRPSSGRPEPASRAMTQTPAAASAGSANARSFRHPVEVASVLAPGLSGTPHRPPHRRRRCTRIPPLRRRIAPCARRPSDRIVARAAFRRATRAPPSYHPARARTPRRASSSREPTHGWRQALWGNGVGRAAMRPRRYGALVVSNREKDMNKNPPPRVFVNQFFVTNQKKSRNDVLWGGGGARAGAGWVVAVSARNGALPLFCSLSTVRCLCCLRRLLSRNRSMVRRAGSGFDR